MQSAQVYDMTVANPGNTIYDYFWPTLLLACVLATPVIIWLLCLVFGPRYRIYKQRLQGQADLAEAEFESRVRVTRAHAEQDAAKHEAAADVIRAKGIADSITLVEDKLGGPDGYLRWKYIHMLEQNADVSTVIYVPTEAGLPILEAGQVGKRASALSPNS